MGGLSRNYVECPFVIIEAGLGKPDDVVSLWHSGKVSRCCSIINAIDENAGSQGR